MILNRKPAAFFRCLPGFVLGVAVIRLLAGSSAAAAPGRGGVWGEAFSSGRSNLVAVAGTLTSGVACGPGVILYSSTTHQDWSKAAGADSSVDYTSALWSQVCYLVGGADGSIWRSTNPTGNSFSRASQGSSEPIRGLGLLRAAGAVLAVGDHGSILKSTDLTGGSWVAQEPLVSTTLRAVLANATSCVIVGDNGVILRGNPQGTGWTVVPKGITQNLLALTKNPFNQFLAVGEGGVIWKGEADGLTWTRLNSFTRLALRGATQVGFRTIVVGDDGIIYLSNGGFQNWEAAVSPVTVGLNAVFFTDADVIAAGDNGRLLWSYTGLQWRLPVVPVERTTWGGLKHRFSGRGGR